MKQIQFCALQKMNNKRNKLFWCARYDSYFDTSGGHWRTRFIYRTIKFRRLTIKMAPLALGVSSEHAIRLFAKYVWPWLTLILWSTTKRRGGCLAASTDAWRPYEIVQRNFSYTTNLFTSYESHPAFKELGSLRFRHISTYYILRLFYTGSLLSFEAHPTSRLICAKNSAKETYGFPVKEVPK